MTESDPAKQMFPFNYIKHLMYNNSLLENADIVAKITETEIYLDYILSILTCDYNHTLLMTLLKQMTVNIFLCL